MRGQSMAPALLPGDEILLAPWDRAPAPGDIVLARVQGSFVVHRVVWAGPTRLVTRGDGCIRADPPVPRSAVPYRVAAVRRSGVEQPPPPPQLADAVRRGRRRDAWVRAVRGVLGLERPAE